VQNYGVPSSCKIDIEGFTGRSFAVNLAHPSDIYLAPDCPTATATGRLAALAEMDIAIQGLISDAAATLAPAVFVGC